MLSLKHSRTVFVKASTKIVDVPEEILDLILEYVFAACGGKVGGIIPVSLTCQRLRSSALPILFKNVIVLADSNGLKIKSQNALRQLSALPHLLEHVRHLHLLTQINDDARRPSDPASHCQASAQLLSLAALKMTRLKRIWYNLRLAQVRVQFSMLMNIRLDHLSDLTISLLQALADKPDLRLTLDLVWMRNDLSDSSFAAQFQEIAARCQWSLDVSFPPMNRDFTRRAVVEFVLASRNIIAFNSYRTSHLIQYFAASENTFSRVQELYISSIKVESLSLLMSSDQFPWRRLHKLQVEGDDLVESLLTEGFERMSNLTHLRLNPCRMRAFHPECRGNAGTNNSLGKSPFTPLRNLRHLELFSVCNHLKMEQITTPTLRSLRIQLPEFAIRQAGLESVRSPAEIKWLAKNVPHLETLELHIGDLENLWHPTAIPGVDVDVEVYQFLQALTELSNLRQLRLFPYYIPGTSRQTSYSARQPLSDEQAVRIFRHLKAQRPTLEMLAIAATFESPYSAGPMSWTVRNAGDTVVLVTRQAGKSYEIEQIWEGERRISMSNKRHTYRQPYLPDLVDWTYRLSRKPERPPMQWIREDQLQHQPLNQLQDQDW